MDRNIRPLMNPLQPSPVRTMSPERELSNIASWNDIGSFVDSFFPDNERWTDWKALSRKFIQNGINCGLNRYFRASQSHRYLVFSTDDKGVIEGPRVTIDVLPPDQLRVAWGAILFGSPKPDYTLPFEPGFATFHRFLYQLWTATMAEPIPENIRVPRAPLTAPVLVDDTIK